MKTTCLRALLCRAALVLLMAAGGSSREQHLRSKVAGHSADLAQGTAEGAVEDNSTDFFANAPESYLFRICNAYTFSQKLQVFQVRTATLLFDLPYKHCKDSHIVIEEGEQIDFRLEDFERDLIMEGDANEIVADDKKKFEEMFNHNDIAKDGVITFKEFDDWHRVARRGSSPEAFVKDLFGSDTNASRKLFDQMDENEDGKISVKDFVDWQTFGNVASVDKDLIASFIVSGELPDAGNMATLLLLVIYKTPGKTPGTFLSGSFLDHAFGAKELDGLGKSAVLCIMDTYHAKADLGHKVHVAYSNVSDGTDFSAGEHEVMPYGTIVGINEGFYQLDLGKSSKFGTDEIDEHVLHARLQINYVVVRVGDTSDDAEPYMDYREELIVFPNSAEQQEDPASAEEVAVYDGISTGLIVAAVLVACGCVGVGAAGMQAGKSAS